MIYLKFINYFLIHEQDSKDGIVMKMSTTVLVTYVKMVVHVLMEQTLIVAVVRPISQENIAK